jgi:hypothetical protein
MKYSTYIFNIAISILVLKLLRNFLCLLLEVKSFIPEEHAVPFYINFTEFLYPAVVFAVTIILARFLIERPTIFARNLFSLIQVIAIFYILLFSYSEWIASIDAPTIVVQINYLFIAMSLISVSLGVVLIRYAYLIKRDSDLLPSPEGVKVS